MAKPTTETSEVRISGLTLPAGYVSLLDDLAEANERSRIGTIRVLLKEAIERKASTLPKRSRAGHA